MRKEAMKQQQQKKSPTSMSVLCSWGAGEVCVCGGGDDCMCIYEMNTFILYSGENLMCVHIYLELWR